MVEFGGLARKQITSKLRNTLQVKEPGLREPLR